MFEILYIFIYTNIFIYIEREINSYNLYINHKIFY